jgi:light-regulated signal transduction histidine kinase (bacteriophytochrome)
MLFALTTNIARKLKNESNYAHKFRLFSIETKRFSCSTHSFDGLCVDEVERNENATAQGHCATGWTTMIMKIKVRFRSPEQVRGRGR